MLLVVLIGRRFAILITNRRKGLAVAQLHLRLVALFAGIAAVPTLLVVVFASLLFQFGVQFWFSDRVKTILDSSNQVAQAYVEENRQRIGDDIVVMAADVLYEKEYAILVGECMARSLAPDGVAMVADPGRLALPMFRDNLMHVGLEIFDTVTTKFEEGPVKQEIQVMRLRHRPIEGQR